MNRPRLLPTIAAGAAAALIGVGAAFGVSAGGPPQIDPDTLAMPAPKERSSWVRADGSVDQSRVPTGREDWRRADGRVDCGRAPATMSIATFDGRLLLDNSGREVQMPSLSGCHGESPELVRAWIIKVTGLQEDDARRRGLPVPPPPEVVISSDPPPPAGGAVTQGGAP